MEAKEMKAEEAKEDELLVDFKKYMEFGIYIGTNRRTEDMKPFIYSHGGAIYRIDINQTDKRIRLAARLLSRHPPGKVAVFGRRMYAQKPLREFCKRTGFLSFPGRFVPGTLTNPNLPGYIEPEVVIVSDPRKEYQVIKESRRSGIPVIALVDTNNTLNNVDFAIPVNNKGRKALALVYWLLTNQVLRERGELGEEETIEAPPESYMVMIA